MKVELPSSETKTRFSDDAIAGASAGATARLLTAPFDVLKIRFQLQGHGEQKYKTMLQSFRTVIQEEGILALWKGNLSATYLWVTYMMVQFSIYGVLKRIGENTPNPFLSRSNNNNHNEERSNKMWKGLVLFLAGAGAGITSVTVTYPFDIMRTQFALQGKDIVYKSMGSFISHTYRVKGFAGFYAGLTPAMVGITPQMGLNFALYESFKLLAHVSTDLNTATTDSNNGSSTNRGGFIKDTVIKGICGGAAGGLSKLAVYPLDTVKKRLQAQALRNTMQLPLSHLPYHGFIDCFRSILINEGMRGLYRGLVPTTAKSVASAAVTFAAYEAVKDLLSVHHGRVAEAEGVY